MLHHNDIWILCFRNIDDVDKTMDEINEQTENMKQIQEALSTPIGAAADFDEVCVFSILNVYLRHFFSGHMTNSSVAG